VLYTRRLQLSFLSRSLFSRFCLLFVCIFLFVFTVYRLVVALSQIFPGFVGKNSLFLVHFDDFCALFSRLWALRLYLCSCDCIVTVIF
jgi:hypothetical protein